MLPHECGMVRAWAGMRIGVASWTGQLLHALVCSCKLTGDAQLMCCCALLQVMAVLSSAAMVAGPALFDPSSAGPHVVGVLLHVLGGSPGGLRCVMVVHVLPCGSACLACFRDVVGPRSCGCALPHAPLRRPCCKEHVCALMCTLFFW